MNYYKILEVDKDASSEVIEKAYKTLAKKYHPDLQESNMKQKAEEKLKLINEAYEILSNPDSRAKYDATLKQDEISEEDFNRLSEENRNLYNELNNLKHNTNNYYDTSPNINTPSYEDAKRQSDYQQRQYEEQLEYEKQMQQARQKAYHDAYIQDLKNRGYKIRYKKTFSDRIKDFIALLIFVGILLLLWQLPFVRNFFMDIYNNNPLIQVFVNLFKK